jgi:hypothetical protein
VGPTGLGCLDQRRRHFLPVYPCRDSHRQSETHSEGGPGTPAEAWPIAIVSADLDAIFMISTSERHDRDPRVDIPQWGIWDQC